MHSAAKRELARLILETARVRESSFDPIWQQYRLTPFEAAAEACADPDLAPLVGTIVASRYCKFFDWAERMALPVVEAAE